MKLTRAALSKIVKEEIQKLAPRKKINEVLEGEFSPNKFTEELTNELFNNDSFTGNTVASNYIANVFKKVAKVANKNSQLMSTLGATTPDDAASYYEYMQEAEDDTQMLDELEYDIAQGILGVLMDASEKIAKTMADYYSLSLEMEAPTNKLGK